MAKFSPTDAVFEGFRFARSHPAALLIWAAFLLVVLTVASLALFDLGGASMTGLVAATQAKTPNPTVILNLMSDLAPASAFALLLCLVFGAVLVTAMLRVFLKPGPHSWGGLRLGGEELRMLAVVMAILAVNQGAEILAIVAAQIAASASSALALTVFIAGNGLILALNVRISLAPVVAMAENRISLPRAFALTRGRFWPLLLAYLLLGVIMLVILALVMMLFGALMAAAATVGGGGVSQLAFALQHNYQDINPVMLLLYVLVNFAQVWVSIVALTASLAIAAQAYKAFRTDTPST